LYTSDSFLLEIIFNIFYISPQLFADLRFATSGIFVKGIYTEHTETFDRVDATLHVLKLANEFLDSNQRIYVHCQRGEDRTGVFVSLLRDLKDNWKKEFSNYGGSYYTALKKHREDVVRKMQQLNL
jgi:protein tyrosine/serine phosphatase